ncbi:MAG TPA: hypothetical protein VNT60_01200 [Deinococcales bacterium]|nr:hypothetical protein [Deinococcales bacterium]
MIGVVTDAACDLTPATLSRLGIGVLPRGGAEDAALSDERVLSDWLQVFDGLVVLPARERTAGSLAERRVRLLGPSAPGGLLGELTMLAADLAREGLGLQDLENELRAADAAGHSLYWREGPPPARGLLPLSRPGASNVVAVGALGKLLPARSRSADPWDALALEVAARVGKQKVRLAVTIPPGSTAESERAREAVRSAGLRVKRGRVYLPGPEVTALIGTAARGLAVLPA